MEDTSTPRYPEELLYRMGHSTRAMNAFFALSEEEQQAVLACSAQSPDDEVLERTLSHLEALGADYEHPIR